MKPTNLKEEAGSALILVMSVMAVLVVIVAVAVEYTSTIGRHVQRTNTLQAAIAIADGALESEFSYWREVCRINTTQAMPTSYMQYIPLPTQADFPNIPNFTAKAGTSYTLNDEYDSTYMVSDLKVVAVDPQFQPLSSVSATPNPGYGMSGNDATFNYIASADVTLPTLRGNVVARVRRVFQKQQYSPWTYAIFYVDPLEIHPGPAFTVTGPVHTNSDLYTGHASLTFADKVTYARDWSIGFMPGDGTHPETPASPSWAPGLPPALDIAHQPFGLDTNRIFNDPTNPNETDHYHELIEPPASGYTDPLIGQRYYDQKGIIVNVDASNNVTYARSNGDGTTTALTSSSSGTDLQLYNMIKGTVTTNQLFQDNREGAQVRIATLDVSKLYNVTLDAPKKVATITWKAPTFNGILYLQDTSATSSVHRGFRLKNGQFIANGGLTVASPNAVYIQGDFNTGTSPPSNSGTPTAPEGDISGVGGKNLSQGGQVLSPALLSHSRRGQHSI